jgi:hypothetical protein
MQADTGSKQQAGENTMKTVYTLTVRANVNIPTGTLNLDVGNERTFIFANITERQKILEWVRAQGWVHSTNIENIMTADEVRKEITRSIEQTCEHFHHPVPQLEPGTFTIKLVEG